MNFEDVLAQDGRLVYKTFGASMKPMLYPNRDLVSIIVPDGQLKKYDVALYTRGDRYVLHRVIGVRETIYLIRGDNTYTLEEGPFQNVIGVLESFVRNGKQISVKDRRYRIYVRIWNLLYPARYIAIGFRRSMRKRRNMAE